MSASFVFEIFVPEKFHFSYDRTEACEKVVDRAAKLIATEVGVYPKPTRADVLRKYAKELEAAGIDFGSIEEVQVTISPFCG
jgi:hypothetical protein